MGTHVGREIVRKPLVAGMVICCALLALIAAGSGLGSAKANGNDFLVRTGDQFGFGAYPGSAGTSEPASVALRDAFGQPSRAIHQGSHECELVWGGLGIRVLLVAFGSASGACSNGTFIYAVLTDRRWHTPDRVHVGSSRRKARRESTYPCESVGVRGNLFCPKTGYAFGAHRTDCATSKSPNVIAHTSRRRVLSLIVYWRGCE